MNRYCFMVSDLPNLLSLCKKSVKIPDFQTLIPRSYQSKTVPERKREHLPVDGRVTQECTTCLYCSREKSIPVINVVLPGC